MEGIKETGDSSSSHETTLSTENRESFLRAKTAELVGVPASEVEWRNLGPYLGGGSRFLYGFTRGNFIKIGGESRKTSEPPREQLKRESLAMEIAAGLNFPVIEIRVPFTLLGPEQNEGLLAIQKLTFEEGLLLASNEQVAVAPPILGTRVAECLLSGNRQIPDNLETGVLKRGDWRSSSPDTFRQVWEEEVTGVTKAEYDQERDGVLGREKLAETIKEGREAIEELLSLTQISKNEYLVHNDMSPSNVFMENGGRILILDWEHAGATHYENLALLTDITNFWARCWPNPEMQAEFIRTYYQESLDQNNDERLTYLMLKTMIIHGSLFLAKYGMDPSHHEHSMSLRLLANLEANLKVLEDTKEEAIRKGNAGDTL